MSTERKKKAKKQVGRPKLAKGEGKERITSIRFQFEEHERYSKLAEKKGQDLSTWVRETLKRVTKG